MEKNKHAKGNRCGEQKALQRYKRRCLAKLKSRRQESENNKQRCAASPAQPRSQRPGPAAPVWHNTRGGPTRVLPHMVSPSSFFLFEKKLVQLLDVPVGCGCGCHLCFQSRDHPICCFVERDRMASFFICFWDIKSVTDHRRKKKCVKPSNT
jgi:hypothetical protein